MEAEFAPVSAGGSVSKRKIPAFPPVHAVSRRENHAAPGPPSGHPGKKLIPAAENKQPALPVPAPAPLPKKNRKAWRKDNVLSLPPSCRKCYSGAYCSNG
jgi:hypothetical protein